MHDGLFRQLYLLLKQRGFACQGCWTTKCGVVMTMKGHLVDGYSAYKGTVNFLFWGCVGCAKIHAMKNKTHANPDVPQSLPRGRHGLSRELVRASQRTRLLDAMADLTAEKGYVAVTIGDIVTRGGVAKRTFYEYFTDKEACFLAAGEYLAGKVAESIVVPHDPEIDLYHRAEATIRSLLQTLQNNPSYARASFVEVWAVGPKAINRRLDVIRQLAQLLASLSEDVSRRQSTARAITETHALAVISAIEGQIFRVIYYEGANNLTDHVETFAQLATGFLKADMSRLNPKKSEPVSEHPTPEKEES